MEKIIDYLKSTYHPTSIVLYGSYRDGTQDDSSDFDCMLLVVEKEKNHDDTMVEGVQLDCYIYTEEEAQNEDADTFLTIYDGQIILDNGSAAALQERVRRYVAEHTHTDDEEKAFITAWIRKMMRRMDKQDDEGSYRAIAFLWESLADYDILRDRFYFGSKKAIRYLQEHDCEGYALFRDAIRERTDESIRRWAEYVIQTPEKTE